MEQLGPIDIEPVDELGSIKAELGKLFPDGIIEIKGSSINVCLDIAFIHNIPNLASEISEKLERSASFTEARRISHQPQGHIEAKLTNPVGGIDQLDVYITTDY